MKQILTIALLLIINWGFSQGTFYNVSGYNACVYVPASYASNPTKKYLVITIPAEITVDIRLVPKATSNISSIINANNNRITFRNCTIWYYGYTDHTLVFNGKMTFDTPDFGASRVTANDALFIDKLWNGLYLPAGKTFIQKPYYLN